MQYRITDSTVYRWSGILLFTTGWKLIWDRVSMLTKESLIHTRTGYLASRLRIACSSRLRARSDLG